MSKKKQGRIVRRAKPKTWDYRKTGGNAKLKLGNMPPSQAAALISRLSDATGWREDWFMDKPDAVLLGLAAKYL